MTDDLDRLLRDAPREFPRPDPGFTDAVRRALFDRLRRPRRRRGIAPRLLPILIVAAAAFVLGHWVVEPAASVKGSSLLVTANGPRPQTVVCRSALMIYLDPDGRITVLQYAMTPGGVPSPTGATIAYLDATTRSLTRVCPARKNPKLRAGTLVGPWPRNVSSRVFCSGVTPSQEQTALQVQVRAVVNRSGRGIGNRLVLAERGVIVADARITRTGGGISFDPFRCARNVWK